MIFKVSEGSQWERHQKVKVSFSGVVPWSPMGQFRVPLTRVFSHIQEDSRRLSIKKTKITR